MSERSSVLKLLKDGKLSEKSWAGRNRTFGKTLFGLLIHQRWLYIDYMSLFWGMLHSKLTSSLLIYHNFIIDKMSYQAEWNGFVGWICIWPAGHVGKRPLAYINASYVLISI